MSHTDETWGSVPMLDLRDDLAAALRTTIHNALVGWSQGKDPKASMSEHVTAQVLAFPAIRDALTLASREAAATAELDRLRTVQQAISECRDDPAKAIVDADRIAGEHIIRAVRAEAERDAAVAAVARAQALADEWEGDGLPFGIYRAQALRRALDGAGDRAQYVRVMGDDRPIRLDPDDAQPWAPAEPAGDEPRPCDCKPSEVGGACHPSCASEPAGDEPSIGPRP